MTCIVSFKENNKIYIGGDTCAVSDLAINSRIDPKVFKNKDMLIGYAGSFRMGQLMRFAFNPPKHPKDKDSYEYMCIDVVKAMQKCFTKHGLDGSNKRGDKESAGEMLIAYKGVLYEFYNDYQVGISAESFSSIGVGSELAIGAMHVLEPLVMNAEDKVRIALEAATKFNGGVSAPFVILYI